MELVDVYNKRHEKLNYTKGRRDLITGEYRLSCFVWIINNDNQILIQQRLATAKKCPDMWSTTGGGAKAGEDSITGTLTELKEELGITLNKENLTFIGSFIRFNDFVEIFVANINIDINNIKIAKDEVQDVKWISIDGYAKMIEDGRAVPTSFNIFKNYYQKYYKKHIEIEDGKLIIVDDH